MGDKGAAPRLHVGRGRRSFWCSVWASESLTERERRSSRHRVRPAVRGKGRREVTTSSGVLSNK